MNLELNRLLLDTTNTVNTQNTEHSL